MIIFKEIFLVSFKVIHIRLVKMQLMTINLQIRTKIFLIKPCLTKIQPDKLVEKEAQLVNLVLMVI